MIGLSCMFYCWCCPIVPSVSRKREGFPLQGLQYVYDFLMVGGVSDRSTDPSKQVVCVWDKKGLDALMLWLSFTLMNLQQLRMLARVPIISAYDPRRESMLAYASPSNRIAIVITGLVTQSIAQGQFHNSYHHFSTLAIFTLLLLYLNSPQFIFTCSLLLQTYPTTPTKYSQFHTCSR